MVFGVGRWIIGGGENVGSCLAGTGSRISGGGAGEGMAETGVAKLVDLETAGDPTRTGVLGRVAVVGVDTAPSSRLTSFRIGSLPEKNSPAVREGVGDGTGGYISDWKESDYTVQVRNRIFLVK